MNKLNIWADKDALRLIEAIVTGGLTTLVLFVNEYRSKAHKGEKVTRKSIKGIQRVDLFRPLNADSDQKEADQQDIDPAQIQQPLGLSVVGDGEGNPETSPPPKQEEPASHERGSPRLFCDATMTVAKMEAMIGRPVKDITPAGTAEQKQPIFQDTTDVNSYTSDSTVFSLIRVVLSRLPGRPGLIFTKDRRDKYRGDGADGKDGEKLPLDIRSRVVMYGHYGGEDSRGSNAWITQCDYLLCVGTPRPPSDAIQKELIELGRLEAAILSEEEAAWRHRQWTGTTTTGSAVSVKTSGYTNPDWNMAQQSFLKSELIQAAGRGRAVLEGGIPVLIFSNENLGFLITESFSERVTRPEQDFLNALKEASEASGKSTQVVNPPEGNSAHSQPSGECALNPSILLLKETVRILSKPVRTATIAAKLGIKIRQAQKTAASLEQKARIKSHGKHVGWTLSDAPPVVDLHAEWRLAQSLRLSPESPPPAPAPTITPTPASPPPA